MTPVLLAPETVAENCCCHFSGIASVEGEMPTTMLGGGVTLTEAEPDDVPFAALTAVTV